VSRPGTSRPTTPIILRESDARLWIYDIAAGVLRGSIDTTALQALRRPITPLGLNP
jgi:hypothetical protein